jgi:hypothetical protein
METITAMAMVMAMAMERVSIKMNKKLWKK